MARSLIKKKCKIPECTSDVRARGWCFKHYQRWKSNGNPLVTRRASNGEGSRDVAGRLRYVKNGRQAPAYVWKIEKLLGRRIMSPICIHHVDGNPANDSNSNLVVCPSHAYHMLLHQRQLALDTCGHADWIKCVFCKEYDSPANMYIHGRSRYHNKCFNTYERQRRRK